MKTGNRKIRRRIIRKNRFLKTSQPIKRIYKIKQRKYKALLHPLSRKQTPLSTKNYSESLVQFHSLPQHQLRRSGSVVAIQPPNHHKTRLSFQRSGSVVAIQPPNHHKTRLSFQRLSPHSPNVSLDPSQYRGKWFKKLSPIFVITTRQSRWESAKKRFLGIEGEIIKWNGTDGKNIDKTLWRKDRRVGNFKLRRGQIGCYDSHKRIWECMVKDKIPYALILEDDANLTIRFSSIIGQALADLEKHDPEWDLFYLSRSKLRSPITKRISSRLAIPGPSWGCFAYAISLRGASILLKNAFPMRVALDNYVSSCHSSLRAYTIYPNIFYVVPVRSDTRYVK